MEYGVVDVGQERSAERWTVQIIFQMAEFLAIRVRIQRRHILLCWHSCENTDH